MLKEKKCWPITDKHYRPFTILKRNGTERELVTVDKNLQEIQSNLLIYLGNNYDVSKYAHGFVAKGLENKHSNKNKKEFLTDKLRNKGVITNSLPHTDKKVVISLDLKDFFPSITFPRVMGLLKSEVVK